MLWRFSMYGFLKNQRYFEPFLILAFLQMGLSYTSIGFLIAFREIMINIMEVPSGAMADTWGRRRSMVLSMSGYICSFAIFGLAGIAFGRQEPDPWFLHTLLYLAMLFFAVGDAFRTGTHKSMIFTWLRLQNRTCEKTKIYGYTRSWSKIGSAVSVVLAGIFVYFSKNYIAVFFITIIPYLINLINLGTYPKKLEGREGEKLDFVLIFGHLKKVLKDSVKTPALRRLMSESMGFDGHFTATKDYLQPVLKNAALPLAAVLLAGLELTDIQSSVILIIPIFGLLFLLSAFASRKAHVIVDRLGDEDRAAKILWFVTAFAYGGMIPAMIFGVFPVIIAGFVLLYVMQNVWRPILISRYYRHSDEESGATVLSVESQAKSLSAMLLAPAIGFAVDKVKEADIGNSEFRPMAVTGTVISLIFFFSATPRLNKTKPEGTETGCHG